MRTLSIATLRAWDAYDLTGRIADLEAYLARPVAEREEIPLYIWVLRCYPDPHDVVWLLRCYPDGAGMAVQVARYVKCRLLDAACEARMAAALAWLASDRCALPRSAESLRADYLAVTVADAAQYAYKARKYSWAAANIHHGTTLRRRARGAAANAALSALALVDQDDIRASVRAFTLKLLGVLP
jgi:hypothetical protein